MSMLYKLQDILDNNLTLQPTGGVKKTYNGSLLVPKNKGIPKKITESRSYQNIITPQHIYNFNITYKDVTIKTDEAEQTFTLFWFIEDNREEVVVVRDWNLEVLFDLNKSLVKIIRFFPDGKLNEKRLPPPSFVGVGEGGNEIKYTITNLKVPFKHRLKENYNSINKDWSASLLSANLIFYFYNKLNLTKICVQSDIHKSNTKKIRNTKDSFYKKLFGHTFLDNCNINGGFRTSKNKKKYFLGKRRNYRFPKKKYFLRKSKIKN
jgi:hypothetical protein